MSRMFYKHEINDDMKHASACINYNIIIKILLQSFIGVKLRNNDLLLITTVE